MKKKKMIGFIGTGNMGEALIAGLLKAKFAPAGQIMAFDTDGRRLQFIHKKYGITKAPLMDAVTGLSGSGPAYVFLIIEALTDAGVHLGMTRSQALTLVTQTILGSVKLLFDTGEHPPLLREKVTSPGGTTAAGLYKLEEGGLPKILMDAVIAATRKSKELGDKMNQ